MREYRSIHNVRDLGGIVTEDGTVLHPCRLIRGGKLDRLTVRDAEQLADAGVTTVLDLRTAQEAREKPDRPVSGTTYRAIPLFDEQTSGITHEKDRRIRDKIKAIPDMPRLYREMVTRPGYVQNLKEILSFVVETVISSDGAVYYHCTAGKDRTGVLSLLLLSLCGVPFESILEDYLRTNDEVNRTDRRNVFFVSLLVHDPAVTRALKQVFRAEPSYLQAAADAIAETYGSMDSFLKDTLEIFPEQREAFCRAVLTRNDE
ncbi:MAG: tyrosine-protein phosphatase [Clostridia bacterium]|nr:tyrosine-protein phosphatase [Clostridia bacterium]